MPAYDYAELGDYFITLVVKDRGCILDKPAFRACISEAWTWLAHQYPFVELDEYVVMPNHLHGILTLTDAEAGGSRAAPTGVIKRKPVGQLVGAFKTTSTKRINLLRGTPGQLLWQRNYYEHLIRTEQELQRVRTYIASNPAMWDDDPENPSRVEASLARKTV